MAITIFLKKKSILLSEDYLLVNIKRRSRRAYVFEQFSYADTGGIQSES